MEKQQSETGSKDVELSGWAILELMGHRRLGGRVSEVRVAGTPFIKIDVPGPDKKTVATQLYSPGSVYAITPCSEEAAMVVAKLNTPEPVTRWEIASAKRLEAETPARASAISTGTGTLVVRPMFLRQRGGGRGRRRRRRVRPPARSA